MIFKLDGELRWFYQTFKKEGIMDSWISWFYIYHLKWAITLKFFFSVNITLKFEE